MGVCASSSRTKGSKVGGGANYNMKEPSTAKVIHVDGRLQVLKIPMKAKNVICENPSHFLCSSESMSIGTCMPQMTGEEELQLGQIYFLIPLSQAHKKVTLRDMCSLALKANSVCS